MCDTNDGDYTTNITTYSCEKAGASVLKRSGKEQIVVHKTQTV